MGSRSNDGPGHWAFYFPNAKQHGIVAKVNRLMDEAGATLAGSTSRTFAMAGKKPQVDTAITLVRRAIKRLRAERSRAVTESSDEANRRACLRIGSARARLQYVFEWGFSQHDVAVRLGVSDSTYQKLEEGRVSLTVGRASVLAGMLGIPVEAIVSPLNGDDLKDEMELLRLFRDLTPGQRTALLDVARNFTERPHSQSDC